MPLILRVHNLNIVKLWVDTSYAMHPYCHIHAGATISLWWLLVARRSKRQNLNSRSSTEAELIGSDDVIPAFLCSRSFIEAQGFKVEEAVLYQDNLSAMLLENIGILSSRNRTKHICTRYFLIKDIIAMGVLKVKYWPMGVILAVHFTKPLQGTYFPKFRAEIHGILEETPDTYLVWDRP